MIHLEDKYFLQPYSYGWILLLEYISDKDGKILYKQCGYYGSLTTAIEAYINKRVSSRINESVFELQEAVRIIQEENSRIEELIGKIESN